MLEFNLSSRCVHLAFIIRELFFIQIQMTCETIQEALCEKAGLSCPVEVETLEEGSRRQAAGASCETPA